MSKASRTNSPEQANDEHRVSSLQPPELYRQCLECERTLTKENFETLKIMLLKAAYFGRPVFEPPPELDPSSIKPERDLKIRTAIWEGNKYCDIVEVLRKAKGKDARLFLLAWWLKQENICEPEDLLGPDALRRMANQYFRGFSFTDSRYASLVDTWLPYFEKLLNDLRYAQKSSGGPVPKLVNAGYDELAVQCALRKRSAIAAACEWLVGRETFGRQLDAPTLRNAYSRFSGTRRTIAVSQKAESNAVKHALPEPRQT